GKVLSKTIFRGWQPRHLSLVTGSLSPTPVPHEAWWFRPALLLPG
ncbi:unnamed protein product, partial [Ectocarpus fasciculatus]